ncbi:lysophospholipase I [Mycena sp. CBHHK59/15]|nr:lysophospholipase I [Mycena sp. CBHHK59/15]
MFVMSQGLGDTIQGFSPVANLLRSDPALNHVQFIIPQAYDRTCLHHFFTLNLIIRRPLRKVTGNSKRVMPAWFDVYSFELPLGIPSPGDEDEDGMLHTIASIDALLTKLVESGVDPSRIVLGGLSQGAAISLLTGLTIAKKLAGLFVLSGRLPLRNKLKTMVSPHASSIPVFWAHGKADPLVKYQLGRVSADFLMTEIGLPAASFPGAPEGLDFHTYETLAHSVCEDELSDLGSWLAKILPPLDV